MFECRIGSYSVGSQLNCTLCPKASACPDTKLARIDTCPFGTYSSGGKSVCEPCPAGYACSTDGAVIHPCENGQYSVSGQGDCHNCRQGFECPYKNVAIETPCNPGTYSNGSLTECLLCPVGYECSTTHAQLCSAGTFRYCDTSFFRIVHHTCVIIFVSTALGIKFLALSAQLVMLAHRLNQIL